MVDIKQRLKEYRSMEKELKQIEELIDRIRARYLSAYRITDMPKGGGRPVDLSGSIAKLNMLEEMYGKKWDALIEARFSIESAIESLPSRERTLMRFYYIDGLSMGAIARRMNYSVDRIKHIHGEALQRLRS